MKIYFEETGETTDNGITTIEFQMYVKPNKYGEAYTYDLYGNLTPFSWADKDQARRFNHQELPPELWYSFTHGIDTATLPEEKRDNWQPGDLHYKHLTKDDVKKEKKRAEEFLKEFTKE